MPKTLAKSDGYAALLNKVRKTLIEGQRRVEQERVRTYWETGRIIHADILKHKDRAERNKEVIADLSRDLGVSDTVLHRCVKFAQKYPRFLPKGACRPKVARGPLMKWSHYRRLITVADDKERSLLEKSASENAWSPEELAARIKQDRPVLPAGADKPVAQLKFTRGKLNTYQIVPANKTLIRRGPLAIDLGFREQCAIPKDAPKLKENDTVELVFGSASGGKDGTLIGARKVEVPKDEMFTYKAAVEKVIDGDTLLVSFGFGCPMSVSQKLRLRGIDCPEIDTEEGKRAKRFVESRLKDCDFIIVKTYKDRADKFDRYLADIFYESSDIRRQSSETDDRRLKTDGLIYLNQELLNERLAKEYV